MNPRDATPAPFSSQPGIASIIAAPFLFFVWLVLRSSRQEKRALKILALITAILCVLWIVHRPAHARWVRTTAYVWQPDRSTSNDVRAFVRFKMCVLAGRPAARCTLRYWGPR